MSAVILLIVNLLGEYVPAVAGNASLIASTISMLTEAIPLIIKECQSVLPMVKNIIAALKADPATTAAQLDTLASLDAQVDAAFEAAAIPQPGDPDYVAPAQ